MFLCAQDLKDFMRSAGEITFADAHKQRVGDGWVFSVLCSIVALVLLKLIGVSKSLGV